MLWSRVHIPSATGSTPSRFIAPTQKAAYFSRRRSVKKATRVGAIPITNTSMVTANNKMCAT